MGRELIKGDRKSMPQLDFQGASSTEESTFTSNVDVSHPLPEHPAPFREPTRSEKPTDRNRTDRLTLLLAIFTALGGLTCAMYFFNGADAVWTILSPPRESFYGRPDELGTANAQLAMLKKNIDPRFALQQASQSNATSAGRSSASTISPKSSGASGALSSGQRAAGNPSFAGVPSRGSGVSGEGSKGGGVTSKVATSLRSTNNRALVTNRKTVARTTKQAPNVAKEASGMTTNRAAHQSNQNSRSTASQAAATTASMRNIPSQSSFGSRAGLNGGVRGIINGGRGNGLSGAVGGALGDHY